MPTPLLLRNGVAELNRLMEADIARLWRGMETLASVEVALYDVLPDLIDTYGAAAATLAADWYDDLRDEVAPPKRFTAIPADIKDSGTQALIGWASATATSDDAFHELILGGSQRRMANFARETITTSSIADPSSVGWKRIGGGGCAFCRMLIQRDQLYSEATADFASHDHCRCSAYPLIQGAEPIDVKDYVKSSRPSSEEDRARVREYLRDNPATYSG